MEEDEKEVWEDPEFEFRKDILMHRSVIVDISGGGLRFISNAKYPAGILLLCRYRLENAEGAKVYETVGKILSAQPAEKRPGCFEYRIQYQNLSNKQREEIIQYIFQQERKNRKKEKGL